MNLKEIQDSLELYAKSNVDLNHTSGNKAFVRFQSKDELAAVKTACSKNVLLVLGFSGRPVGAYDDGRIQQTLVLRFTSYASSTEGALGVQAALSKSYEIMLDMYVRWQREVEEGEYTPEAACSWLKRIDWASVSWDEIDEQPWLVNHYGWDMVVPLRGDLPTYNAEKWRDMEHSPEFSTEFQ